MAPELRKRARVNGGDDAAAKKHEKSPIATKRKAIEESSPVSLKKQKPAKESKVKKPSKETEPAIIVKETTKKSSKKQKKNDDIEESTTEVTETAVVLAEDDAELGEEINQDLEALAAILDSDSEDAAPTDGPGFKEGQDVGKIPKISKKLQKALKASAKQERGVVYIGRLPHGFYEHELRGYFSQFGPVLRCRLSRNKKTGASRHYAFLEFAEAETAEIVAKTMDSYLLFGRILKVKTVPLSQVHESLWKGANRRFKKVPWNKIAGNKLKQPLSETAWADKITNEEKKRAERAQKLKEIGYEFEAPKLKQAPAPPPAPAPAVENGEGEPKAIEAAPKAEAEPTVEEPAPVASEAKAADVDDTVVGISAGKTKALKGNKGKKATKQKKAKA